MIMPKQTWILTSLLYEEEFPALLDTPCKSQAAKQRKTERSDVAILSQLGALSQVIKTRSDSLENMIGENTRAITSKKEVINENTKQITSVTEAIEFLSAEINSLKAKYGVVESTLGKMEQTSVEQDRRLSQLESYSRRWNLRLHGVPEREQEDVRTRDGSRFSNILFNYRISIRLCDYFLKVYQGLTIKTVQWREGSSDLSLTRSGHCRWSLNCIICMRF